MNGFLLGKFLTPIHEHVAPTDDAVFYSDHTESSLTSATIETPTRVKFFIAPQQNDNDSGVANSDREITSSNSGSSLENTPQHDNVPDEVVLCNERASSTSSVTV